MEVKPGEALATTPSHPYNVNDVIPVHSPTILMKHPAGDVAYMGVGDCMQYTIKPRGKIKKVTVPPLRGLENE